MGTMLKHSYSVMNTFELQKFLFEHNPSRLELVDYTSSTKYITFTVFVCRNHSFELIENTIKPYLDYAKITIIFEYSDYDDSLSFSNLNTSADLVILWLDISRYQMENTYGFIEQRLQYLQSIFSKNIYVALLNGENYISSTPGVYTFDLQAVKEKLKEKYIDERLEPYSGTKFSSFSLMEISKLLGLRYLPALLKPGIKAVIVDLDNTLYHGVIDEDGVDGIILTEAHNKLQQCLLDLSRKGLFLCVASKNNFDEVKKLFEIRTDFPLKWGNFTKLCSSWDLKSKAIADLKDTLNINEDSMVFIDDNIGEIMEVMSVFPGINIIHAEMEADITYNVLQNYPGLFRFNSQFEDALRKDDIKANEKRRELQQKFTPDDYMKSLGMVITYKIDNYNDISRIAELSNKTNQFIFSYKRYTVTQISSFMNSENAIVISFFLKDNLSDSGMIGACILKKVNEIAILDELFISCRALGRGIEEILIFNAIKVSMEKLNTSFLKVDFIKGERNLPAELFVNKHLAKNLNDAKVFDYQNSQKLVEVCCEG